MLPEPSGYHAHALAGRRDKAQQFLNQLPRPTEPRDYYNLALIQVALGNNTEAIDTLENSPRLTIPIVAMLKYDPSLDPLRQDTAFTNFVESHGLADKFKDSPMARASQAPSITPPTGRP